MAEMRWRRLDDLMVLVHSPRAPTDDEWRAYVDAFDDELLARGRCIVFTDGGAPTTNQRRIIQQMTVTRPFPTAVITKNRAVRGVITALSWFNAGIRAFAPEDLAGALHYLDASDREDAIARARDELRAEL